MNFDSDPEIRRLSVDIARGLLSLSLFDTSLPTFIEPLLETHTTWVQRVESLEVTAEEVKSGFFGPLSPFSKLIEHDGPEAAPRPLPVDTPLLPSIHVYGPVMQPLTEQQVAQVMEEVYEPYFAFVGEAALRAFADPTLRGASLQLWTRVSLETLPVRWADVSSVWLKMFEFAENHPAALTSLTEYFATSADNATYFGKLLATETGFLRNPKIRHFACRVVPMVLPSSSPFLFYFIYLFSPLKKKGRTFIYPFVARIRLGLWTRLC